ncbi:uncharacterized protein LOC108895503 [Lates calcarifer]|uniref:Uncharacterized protein LOC108895503 n=1 Tax=Lates calcarifer TaxID=8187 RepID=A0AAJ8B1K4_LATCA|nr:uncharacterized protein LOC108895503 [Lates calcarifer]
MAENTPVRLLVILSEDSSVRMELRKGIPNSLEELMDEVKNACGLEGYIRLQYKDTDFGNIFVNLTSTTVIKDLTILKVIQLEPDSTVVLYPVDPPMSSTPLFGLDSDDSSVSAHTDDTILLSSPSSDSLRTQQWPRVFPIPRFSYDTECQLQRGNAEYMTSQTRLTPSSKMLSDILEKVAESIYAYKPYPEDSDFSDVAEALTRKHPCLKEPGSFNESYGWKRRMKIKMANYRTQLKAHGTSAELTVNSLKSKSQEDSYPAKNLKRPSWTSTRPNCWRSSGTQGGRVKVQTKRTLQVLDETVDITIRREYIFKSLMIYLGEPVHHLIKECQDENEADELEQKAMAIVVSGKEDIKIVIDGTEVLKEVPTIATAVAMFFGFTYALNLKYPKNLQYTFEFVQKVLMELGAKKISPKVHKLSTQLFSPE